MAEKELRIGDLRKPPVKKKDDEAKTTLSWSNDGAANAVFAGVSEVPTDEDIRSLIERVGKDPDDYVWDIVSVSWNSAAWHRSEEVAANPTAHSAFTAPSCVVKIRILPLSEASDLNIEIRQAPPLKVSIQSSHRLPKRRIAEGMKCAVIYADSQIWYWQDENDVWHPTHDEAALDVGAQITADVEAEHGIDVMVDLGDLGDFPVVSSHPSPRAMTLHGSSNKAIDRISRLMYERSALSPNATLRRWLQGNHELRWIEWLANNASHLLGIRRAGDEEVLPVLSLAYLTRAEEAGWTLSDTRSYPNDVFWLNDNTRCIHGTVAKTDVGATLTQYLKEEVNTIAGHTPHAGINYRTVARNGKTRTYVACTPGGFMRTDGMVPSGSNKNTNLGQPSQSDGNRWEQGMAVVFYSEDGSTVPQIEHIPIFGGKAVWRGKIYTARCDVDGNPLEAENE